MPYQDTIQGDPLRLVEFARSSQMKRRRSGVHQSVPTPILVLLMGDSLCDQLEQIYNQLTSRWSSQLGALQFCYFYIDKPYQGSCPILQAKVTVPVQSAPPAPSQEGGISQIRVTVMGRSYGAGTLYRDSGSLQAVNKVLREAGEKISRLPMISMLQSYIHMILPVSDPVGALATDIAAVAHGWMNTYGSASADCYLYLLLPQLYNTVADRVRACEILDQVRDGEGGDAGETVYSQPVLLEQQDGQPTQVQLERVFRQVVLLDEIDEKYRSYNQHGERLQLLGDLIENNWSIEGYVITAGAQEATAGPEYWLAQAAYTLCRQAVQDTTAANTNVSDKSLCDAIKAAVPDTMPSWKIMNTCCLFLRGMVERLRPGMSVDEMEKLVFGKALQDAFQFWLDAEQPAGIPPAVQQALEQVDGDGSLKQLANKMRAWAQEQEESSKRPPDPPHGSFRLKDELSEEENVRALQKYLLQGKYAQLQDRAQDARCAQIARICADGCFDRIQQLKQESEMFEEFAEMVRETWFTLRDAFNNGNPMPVQWTKNAKPSSRQLRRAGARAIRDKDAQEVLSLLADCVDLDGNAQQTSDKTVPTLYCRLTILPSANHNSFTINAGISAGRVVKLTTIAQHYNETDICRVFILMKARNA